MIEDLKEITNELLFEDPPIFFTEDYALDLIETVMYLINEYIIENPNAISEPDFQDNLLEEIKNIFYIQMDEFTENELFYNKDIIEDDLDDLLEESVNIFMNSFYSERVIVENLDHANKQEINNTKEEINIIKEENTLIQQEIIENKIQKLREIPQPEQRTPEWYKFRWNLITASNAYKAFESQATQNQLIYEKCQPLKTREDNINEDVKMVNVNSSLHWGQKYEPLSVLIYESNMKTKVEDFGCIQHPKYYFLGASPDGINVDKKSERYGRMLEIKNVVSREINGVPKKEYWVQMQLQMEVCDLDECDFLETKFTEYLDRDNYLNDSTDKIKGSIIYFHTKEGKPFYIYKPLDLNDYEKIIQWEDDMISLYESEKYNYTFIKFIYWKLDVFSCVLVLRNKEWFNNSIIQLEKIWKIIEQERITGYEHRAPVKKNRLNSQSTLNFDNSNSSKGCLLKIIKQNS